MGVSGGVSTSVVRPPLMGVANDFHIKGTVSLQRPGGAAKYSYGDVGGDVVDNH